MSGAKLPLPQYSFMARCSVKKKSTGTLPFTFPSVCVCARACEHDVSECSFTFGELILKQPVRCQITLLFYNCYRLIVARGPWHK
jgi:hypothetical protein